MDKRKNWKSRPESKRIGDRSLIGEVFGGLRVIGLSSQEHGRRLWKCRCECDRKAVVETRLLVSGNTSSCGCRAGRPGGKGHGLARGGWPPEYWVWRAMIRRCHVEGDQAFQNYGARGISVCPEWRNNFPTFYRDLGPRPNSSMSLDRIDNDGNYEPSNCRWATRRQQSRNRQKPLRELTISGFTKPLVDWAQEAGISRQLLKLRIDQMGWDLDRAISTPARRN